MRTNRILTAVLRPPRPPSVMGLTHKARARQLGQVLPIFAVMSIVLLGGAALLTDVAFWWTSELRMQRAADAAALAGAVYLPGNESLAFTAARNEAQKNGYVSGVGNVVVAPRRDVDDPRKLIVDIDAPVQTFFAKVFCWDGGPCLQSVDVGVTGAASFVLPVPMGSPQNYYGVGFLKDAVTTTTTAPNNADTMWRPASAPVSGSWTNPGNAASNNDQYARADGNGNPAHIWRNFDLLADTAGEVPDRIPDANTTIRGIEVRLNDVFIDIADSSCEVQVELWDGTSWTNPKGTGPLGTGSSNDEIVGGASDLWGRAWTRSQFADGTFQVRLTWSCGAAARFVRLDVLEVQVYYTYDVTSTTTTIQEVDVRDPYDAGVLTPQNFWGALQSQGAPNIQGDAYMTWYDTRTSTWNDDFNPASYYQYGVEFPPGASNGEIWLFDPGFCHVDADKGTGEYYTFGSPNGSSAYNRISTYYDLWQDTRHTPLIPSDDDDVGLPAADDYRDLRLRDTVLDASSPVSADPCDDLTWHNDWVQVASDIDTTDVDGDGDIDADDGPLTVRVHSYSIDPDDQDDPGSSNQVDTTGLNAFAIWATATGGTPRVYGLGAMEAYIRLPGGRASEFYLAQIDAEHDGKTLKIELWDPGDTGALAADLQILAPGATNYDPIDFNYTAQRNSGNASDCNSRAGTGVDFVTTNTGGSSRFNGCWLTITIPLIDYTAPHPSSDTVTSEGGWWKIRYIMSGATSSFSTDLTTWQVSVIGNPVHLVME